MTELIVALDDRLDSVRLWNMVENLRFKLNQRWFKVGRSSLLQRTSIDLIELLIKHHKCKIMLDLKMYDPCETIARDAKLAFQDLGVHMLTVYANQDMLRTASAQRVNDEQAVLAIGPTTDSEWGNMASIHPLAEAQGLVLSVPALCELNYNPNNPKKLFVTPGVRPASASRNGHLHIGTPTEARLAGATHIVVGRPIYQAEDPVAVTRAILEELDGLAS